MDDNQSITIAPGQSLAERLMIEQDLDNRTISAITSLRTGKIPDSMISTHPGKGKQVFRYVKHTHATQVLVDAFPILTFDWKILDWEVFADKSAAVRGQLDVHFKNKYGETITLTVIEIGVFEDLTTSKAMPTAALVASAASRALPRSMMRMFGWGIELYPDAKTTPDGWWKAIKGIAASRSPKVPEEIIVNWLKEHEITQEKLEEHYTEIVEFVMSWKP